MAVEIIAEIGVNHQNDLAVAKRLIRAAATMGADVIKFQASTISEEISAVEAPEQRAHWEARFLEAQQRGFVPAGRINSAAGTQLAATLINCFVQPVGDSITEMVDDRGHPPSR